MLAYVGSMISYLWRGAFSNTEVNALHAEGFGHEPLDFDWQAQLAGHSLGWVCARAPADDAGLAGFLNVAWDGACHAFVLDTLVSTRLRRQGVGTGLLACAVREARAAGCEWLHVDFEDHLRPFYFGGCGFTPTNAGLIDLTQQEPRPPR